MTAIRFALTALCGLALTAPLAAQSGDVGKKRTRIKAGAQIAPRYPGARDSHITPLFGLSRAKAGQDFEYSASDQGAGLTLIRSGGFAAGPVAFIEGKRRASDTANMLPKVPMTIEAGGFAQYGVGHFRLRGELRQGINGHKGLIGTLGADLIARDHDNWVFGIGPRLTWASGKFQRAYFGVPAAIPATGLPAYRPSSGVSAIGLAANTLYAFGPRWGVTGFAKYDRLTGDAGRSPVTARFGDRDQLSGGLGLTYTF